MKLKFLAPALLAGFVAFTSCSKEDNKKPDPAPAPAPTPEPAPTPKGEAK